MIIGEQLRKARTDAGMSQEQLAEIMAVSRQTVSNWENSRSYPDIERVMRMADLYHLSLDKMLRGDEQMIQSWLNAANLAKTGKRLSGLLLLNIALTVAIMLFSHSLWLSAILLLLLVGSISAVFYLLIKLI
ncbi:helix-turn-helix transcriptional regulator [Lacticaseibacillus songhuajiangensis]|uniref:helix-turn-helix transcriptional regulator n=1 Tax=Lacticaseibacillus songhuajiangensis TaxID=1296539 RepID=UPI000F78C33E|nr:helix-turn-helix transcriptional regulator [Lacticaseibacillus songhuajiangensis]